MKCTRILKKIVHICIKNGWLTRDPFVGFKLTKREVERPFLVEEELTRIINKEFVMPRLSQVRDIFIFLLLYRSAYADVEKLTRQEITIGIDGENGYGQVDRKQIQPPGRHYFLLHSKFRIAIKMIHNASTGDDCCRYLAIKR